MQKLFTLFAIVALLFSSCNSDQKTSEEADSANHSAQQNQSLINKGVEGTGLTTDSVSNNANASNDLSAEKNSEAENKVHFSPTLPYYISGRLVGGAGGTVILDNLELGRIKPLFSQTVNENEQYDFEGSTNIPLMLQLRLPNGRIHLIVYPGDTITVASTLARPENFTAGGSPATMQLKHMYEILEAANVKKRALKAEMEQTTDKAKLSRLYDMQSIRYEQIDAEKRANLIKYINEKLDTSFVAIIASTYLDPEKNFSTMEKIDKKMAKYYSKSPFYKAMHEKVTAYAAAQPGHYAPEILSKTPEGQDFRLSSLKGKYVLIDFWSSWCQDCRQEMPRLIKIYNKYKNNNFEILGVSVDDKKNDWVEAIKKDQLTWKQVSDLNGYSSANVQTYMVGNIPSNFLIDPEGKIIAKNISIPEIEERLSKLLKK